MTMVPARVSDVRNESRPMCSSVGGAMIAWPKPASDTPRSTLAPVSRSSAVRNGVDCVNSNESTTMRATRSTK